MPKRIGGDYANQRMYSSYGITKANRHIIATTLKRRITSIRKRIAEIEKQLATLEAMAEKLIA